MYAVGKIDKDSSSVALFIEGDWVYKALKNPEQVQKNNLDVGLFHYHSSSDECYWIDPKTIIERAIVGGL